MKHITFTAILAIAALLVLTGCAGGEKYQVDYCGAKDCYRGAKDSYKAGTEVTVYFDLIASDTDYSFLLDGEPIDFDYDEKKGFIITFTMPAHDVTLDVSSVNSMLPVDTGMSFGNPLSDSSLEELKAETGFDLNLPDDQFQDLTVTRIEGDPALYELDFVWREDGRAYTFRLQRSPENPDISGMYYEWTVSEIHEDPDFESYLSADGQGICLWWDEFAAYCVTMTESADRDSLANMRELMISTYEYAE